MGQWFTRDTTLGEVLALITGLDLRIVVSIGYGDGFTVTATTKTGQRFTASALALDGALNRAINAAQEIGK